MNKRDDFLEPTRKALALRAGYRCSFRGCDCPTVGPSDESSTASASTGVAAHIHAAAPGGRRFLDAMTPDERRDISNGIWLCATHATLIDRDESTYSASGLREMKLEHEARMAQRLAMGASASTSTELFALGPDIVFVGELTSGSGNSWTLRADHFVRGDLTALISFGQAFDDLARSKRYILCNELGDGRVLAQSPSWKRVDRGLEISLVVESPFPRTSAEDLGEDLEVDSDGDLKSTLATVSGLEALPQRINLVLWHQEGQYFEPSFGTKIAEYFALFGSTLWFAKLVKLEVIRMASIPFLDTLFNNEYTPFNCVTRVHEVRLLEQTPVNEWLKVELCLDVVGVGVWRKATRLYVPQFPFPETRAVLDELVQQALKP